MSVYLLLFLTFLKVGAVSFGGGYGMIALIQEDCVAHGWLTEEEVLNFIAVAESTPGPIAVNMATFVGSSQGGFLGALLATLGVVLPSFIIILLIAAFIHNLLKLAGVKAALNGVRPAIIGLILATAVTMALRLIFRIETYQSSFLFEWRGLVILAVLAGVHIGYKLWKKKAFSPILLIVLSGCMGVLLF